MYKTISAEYSSIEEAEFTASHIRQNIKDLKKISIQSENNKENFYPYTNSTVTNTNQYQNATYDTSFMGMDAIPFKVNSSLASNVGDNFHSRKSILEIIAGNNEMRNIEAILISHNGRNIKRF